MFGTSQKTAFSYNLDDANKIFREYTEMPENFLFFGRVLLHLFVVACLVTFEGKASVSSNFSTNIYDTSSKFRLKMIDITIFLSDTLPINFVVELFNTFLPKILCFNVFYLVVITINLITATISSSKHFWVYYGTCYVVVS